MSFESFIMNENEYRTSTKVFNGCLNFHLERRRISQVNSWGEYVWAEKVIPYTDKGSLIIKNRSKYIPLN